MKQYSTTIHLSTGLRADYRNRVNSPGLTHLLNAKPGPDMLMPYDGITNPFSVDLANAWGLDYERFPFPQLLRGNKNTVLACQKRVMFVNEDDWSLLELELRDADDVQSAGNLKAGLPWEFIDLHDTWMLTNGLCSVFYSKKKAMFGQEDYALVQSDVVIGTGCTFRGRVMYGGFDPDYFWKTQWKTFFEDESSIDNLGISLDMPISKNMVWWSTIGGGDMLWLIYPDYFVKGPLSRDDAHGYSKPLILDYLERNESGFGVMPWQGSVLTMREIRNGVVVYGEDGISALVPASEPTPTFGTVPILDGVGLANNGAVGGDLVEHIFIDSEGALWVVNGQLEVKRLGFTEFFYDMLGTDIRVSFVPNEREYYISNGDLTYLFRDRKLSEVDQSVSSAMFLDGGAIGWVSDVGLGNSQFEVTTDTIDHNIRGLKHIHSVEFDGSFSTGGDDNKFYVAIDYKYKPTDDFTRTDWVEVNDMGWAVISVSCLEYRVAIKSNHYETTEPPSSITVKWSSVDNRNVRGLHAAQIGTIGGQ